jgi:hypothetical protein
MPTLSCSVHDVVSCAFAEENLLAGTAEVDAENVPWNSLSEKNFFLGKNLVRFPSSPCCAACTAPMI